MKANVTKFEKLAWVDRLANSTGFFFLVVATIGFLAQGFFAFALEGLEEALKMPVYYYATVLAFLCLAASIGIKGCLADRSPFPMIAAAIPALLIGAYNFAFVVERLTQLQADESLKRPIRLCFGMMLFFCVYHYCRSERRMRIYISVLYCMIIASSITVILELVLNWLTPWSRYSNFNNVTSFHPAGLEADYVNLTYAIETPIVMSVISALSLFLGDKKKPYAAPVSLLCIVTAGLGTLGIVGSSSRSGLLGLVGSIALASFFFRKQLPSFFKMGLIGMMVLIPLVAVILPFMEKEGGAIQEDARLGATYVAYGPVILLHPFGIPNLVFDPLEPAATQISTNILWLAATEAEDRLGITIDSNTRESAFKDYPHNVLMTVAMDFGWIGVLCISLIYFYTLRPLVRMVAMPDPVVRITAFMMFAGVLAFMLNSSFHNGNVLQSEPRNWIYLGLALRIARNLGGSSAKPEEPGVAQPLEMARKAAPAKLDVTISPRPVQRY
ncbi:O-antigen ligase family protein [Singulisphaera rosea]